MPTVSEVEALRRQAEQLRDQAARLEGAVQELRGEVGDLPLPELRRRLAAEAARLDEEEAKLHDDIDSWHAAHPEAGGPAAEA